MKEKEEFLLHTYQTIMNMSRDGFLVVDKQGMIVDINDTYVKKLEGNGGLKRENIIGKKVSDYIPTTKLQKFYRAKTPTIERDARQAIAEKFVRNAGNTHLLSTRASISGEEGIIGAVAQVKFYDDITRLMKQIQMMETELDYYKYRLEDKANLVGKPTSDSLLNIVGISQAIEHTKEEIVHAAAVGFNVLLQGETGVGKELFAAAIHNTSPRANGPFIKLNCSAIPADLFESELFGYEEGSFTGALKRGKKGKFELANGGTIFLDEIGDMPMAMQAKLLRVLQEREIDAIGSDKPRPVDVRVIAATNKNLRECIENKTFRSDLFFRLNVINIVIPPLRDRREDISLLIESTLQRLNNQYKTSTIISNEAISVLEDYDWPGNVRELINFVERMYAYAENEIIEVKHIPMLVHHHIDGMTGGSTLFARMKEEEKSIILNALEINKYNCKRTADYLGIHRSTLYKKMDQHGIACRD